MRLGARIFVAYLLIFIVCFYYPVDWAARDLRTRYVEGIEDSLVDHANILAAMVGAEMEHGRFNPDDLHEAFDLAYGRSLSARIYDLLKTRVDMRVYITDDSGRVIFDSQSPSSTGADYSRWRDVLLTLRGEYGARTSHPNQGPAVLHVAAPIVVHGKTVGVLTVGKPTTNVERFLKTATPRILKVGAVSMAAAVLLSLIVSFWIARPIRRLTQYAHDVRTGKRAEIPDLGQSELSEMAMAFEKMREALEGKKYVERYVQTLTHEIKSPLSAIRGAAELLEEEMPSATRSRFLSNIRTEANRIQDIVDRMLELSELENRQILRNVSPFPFGPLVKKALESKEPMLSQKELSLTMRIADDIIVNGDSFLLHQAISNIIQNAIDFSLPNGHIEVAARVEGQALTFTVDDEGPGVPEYALGKVFHKFFSLQRPDTGKKSTGLGLNLVVEVAHLHGGEIVLANRPSQGLRAMLTLPAHSCP